ncbi:undecaprenyl-diphosphate phosphatase [candidate division KSB1 bacterium]
MTFDVLDSIILGLVQGLTEFLPVSSSGHLVVMKNLLDITEAPLMFDIFFHFATLLSICTVFRSDIKRIILSLINLMKSLPDSGAKRKESFETNEIKLVYNLIAGTIPAVIAGLLFKDRIEQFFSSTSAVAAAFLITGLVLLTTKIVKVKDEKLTVKRSVIIGIFQAAALFPGISRSGTTITSGMWTGIRPEEAVKFSFFLAIPAILGANILEFSGLSLEFLKQEILLLAVGGIAAYVSGLAAIKIVMKLIQTGRFFIFGIYCILLGIITFIWI